MPNSICSHCGELVYVLDEDDLIGPHDLHWDRKVVCCGSHRPPSENRNPTSCSICKLPTGFGGGCLHSGSLKCYTRGHMLEKNAADAWEKTAKQAQYVAAAYRQILDECAALIKPNGYVGLDNRHYEKPLPDHLVYLVSELVKNQKQENQ